MDIADFGPDNTHRGKIPPNYWQRSHVVCGKQARLALACALCVQLRGNVGVGDYSVQQHRRAVQCSANVGAELADKY
jgi:hypothetical protein